MHFGENQLSRNLIGLSPLSTGHHNSFQPICVRSSTRFYPASTCPWIAHPVSGLRHATIRPIQTRFPYGYTWRLNLATHRNSLDHNAKGTRSSFTIALSLLVSMRFQILFHSPYRGSFHLSLTVLVHYRSTSSILAWIVVDPDSDKISRVPSYSGYPPVI